MPLSYKSYYANVIMTYAVTYVSRRGRACVSQKNHFVNRIYAMAKTRYTGHMSVLPLNAEKVLAELARREQASRVLSRYAEYSLTVDPAAHHKLICQAIDELLNDEYDELIINSPPGSAKSTYTSHALPSYFMGKFPTKNVILATHTSDLSERWSRKVRNTVASPIHANVFPSSMLSEDSTAVSRWATSLGGEVLAAGVGGSILGFRADLGILDDPISGYEQAQSFTQLSKIHSWYETDFVTRLKPGAKTVLICQRLSPNDLAGYLIARNQENPTKRQRVLILPMIAKEDDPLGRAPGERLWPEWYTEQMVEDAKRDDFKWRTLYQQEPPSESGSWVSADEIQIVPPADAPMQGPTYIAADLALSVNSGDYTVHLTARVGNDLDLYIVDAHRQRSTPEDSADKACELCETYSPAEYLIDDDNASKVFMPLLARTARDTKRHVPYKSLPLRGQNKETRAAAIRGWFKRRKVFFVKAPWNEWLIREVLVFPNAMGEGVDDGIDCLSLLGRRLASMPRLVYSNEPTKPVEGRTATLQEMFDDRERSLPHRRRV